MWSSIITLLLRKNFEFTYALSVIIHGKDWGLRIRISLIEPVVANGLNTWCNSIWLFSQSRRLANDSDINRSLKQVNRNSLLFRPCSKKYWISSFRYQRGPGDSVVRHSIATRMAQTRFPVSVPGRIPYHIKSTILVRSHELMLLTSRPSGRHPNAEKSYCRQKQMKIW